MRFSLSALAALALTAPALAQDKPPLATLRDLGVALNNCLPPQKLEKPARITIWISLKRDGSINGKPRITFAQAQDDVTRERLAKSLIEGLYACTPFNLTPGLGGAVAGRVFSFPYILNPNQGVHDI